MAPKTLEIDDVRISPFQLFKQDLMPHTDLLSHQPDN
jgi:hypothetical protein